MKQNYRVVVSLFLVLGMSILMGQSSLGYAKSNGTFIADYPAVENPGHESLRSIMKEGKLFDQFADGLNQLIAIPGIVTIQARECGKINAFYKPVGGPLAELVMCYELLDHMEQIFSPYNQNPKLKNEMVTGAWMFALLHELGHALIHQLDLPITGKEEDAVDQLSTLLLTNTGASGERAILAGAQWFRLESARNQTAGTLSLQKSLWLWL